jgi:hypothetical protein
MANDHRRINALAEVERVKFLQKATRDALTGAITLSIHNLGITETRNLLAQHRWRLAEFDPNE